MQVSPTGLDWMKFDCEFRVRGNQVKFSVIHCIGEQISAAFDSWIMRTKKFNAKSFVQYVKSKYDPDEVIMTEHQYNKLAYGEEGFTRYAEGLEGIGGLQKIRGEVK